MKIKPDQRRMYRDLAWTWPLLDSPGDYADEARQFISLIRKHSRIKAKTLLNLGCGGGHNDFTLKKHFALTGVDVSGAMLALAERLNPEVEYLAGDMRNMRLSKQFDAVMVADSIDYMLTVDDLRAAFQTAFVHLKPGGVFCTYAEVTREYFKQNWTKSSTYAHGDLDIAFIHNNYDPDPADSIYESTYVWLIRRNGKLDIEADHHFGGIFPRQTWLDLLREIGFKVTITKFKGEKIPFFVGRKPA